MNETSGIYKHLEGTTSTIDSYQLTRELVFDTDVDALRYKTNGGVNKYFYHGSNTAQIDVDEGYIPVSVDSVLVNSRIKQEYISSAGNTINLSANRIEIPNITEIRLTLDNFSKIAEVTYPNMDGCYGYISHGEDSSGPVGGLIITGKSIRDIDAVKIRGILSADGYDNSRAAVYLQGFKGNTDTGQAFLSADNIVKMGGYDSDSYFMLKGNGNIIIEKDFYNVDWTDWTTSCKTSSTGWVTTGTFNVDAKYRQIGGMLYLKIYLSGTSNSTSTSIHLPSGYVMRQDCDMGGNVFECWIRYTDNGTASPTPGLAVMNYGVPYESISFYKDATYATWTNSGTKIITLDCVIPVVI